MRLVLLAVGASLLAATGCASDKPAASALMVAVERFHRASNEERPDRADELALLACEDVEVCAAKKACVDATKATAEALRLKRAAESTLAEVEAGKATRSDPAVSGLPATLERASHLLEEGHAAMPVCDRKILGLRQRYGL
jgi:hypothetical protein